MSALLLWDIVKPSCWMHRAIPFIRTCFILVPIASMVSWVFFSSSATTISTSTSAVRLFWSSVAAVRTLAWFTDLLQELTSHFHIKPQILSILGICWPIWIPILNLLSLYFPLQNSHNSGLFQKFSQFDRIWNRASKCLDSGLSVSIWKVMLDDMEIKINFLFFLYCQCIVLQEIPILLL